MNSTIKATSSLLLVLLLCGCYSVDSHGRKFAVRDPLPEGSVKGYADFSLSPDSEFEHVTVRRIGESLFAGADTVVITGRGSSLLRISAPPGMQKFSIAETVVSVPITDGMVTPVEINTRRVGNSIWADANCRVSVRVLSPVAHVPIQ